MPSKLYDILKWVAIVGLYGLNVLIAGLGEIWGWPYTAEIVKSINIVGTVLGIWLGLSSVSYYKKLAEAKKLTEEKLDNSEEE